ncbi:MAG TPA: CPBP family intramembrane metalloprotease [Epulopiscium sp.]|nr:CPBP family intramembrane metalloprotease [Candidatus Epulonipiscium sp.]
MINKSKSVKGILGISVLSILIMYIFEGSGMTGYFQKSAIKIIMFLGLPVVYTLYDKNIKIRDNFKIRLKKDLVASLVLGIGVYVVILTAYFILKDFIDLSNIIELLDKNVSVNQENFLWVALYISFVNSLLEEFFFRGFIFLNLKKTGGRKFAYISSALVFSIYHVAIMGSWFKPIIFVIAMTGLFVGALIFNYLNEKSNNIYNSWLVHMMANLAINTVGFKPYVN